MNFKLIKLLAALCSVLILVIIAEWQYASYSKKQSFAKLAADTEQRYAPGELPQIKLAQQSEDTYAEMVNRPLFIEGRRPAPESEEEGEQASGTAGSVENSDQPLENFNWELDGIYIHHDTTMALFSHLKKNGRSQKNNDQEQFLKKSKGEEIDGWSLLEIRPNKIVLEKGGKRHELMLRKPKPTQLPPQPKTAPAAPKANPKANPTPTPTANIQNPFLRHNKQ